MRSNNPFHSFKMIGPQRFTRAASSGSPHRTEYAFSSGRKKRSKTLQAAQFSPDQREQLFFDGLVITFLFADFFLSFFQRFRQQLRNDRLFGFKVVEQRACCDARGSSNAAGRCVVPAIRYEKFGRDFDNPRFGF